MAKVLFGLIFVFSFIPSPANTDVFFNSFGPLGGRFMLGIEKPISPTFGAVLTGRYVNQGQGLLTGLIFPFNIASMYNLSMSMGLNVYPFRDSRGFYGSAELDGGYHSTKTYKSQTPSRDSVHVDGIFLSPGVKAGYKWLIRNRFTLSPEAGVSYTWNTTDYSRISQSAVENEEFAFTLSRRQMKNFNNGLHPFLTLQAGYRF